MRPGKALNRAGYSYLELIVVLAILSTITLLALPMLAGLGGKWTLETAAWQLVADMRLARQAAITTGKQTRIEFRQFGNDYRMFLPEDRVTVKLPEGITYAANNFPLSEGVRKVTFSPLGAPGPAGTVTLRNRRGDKLYVILAPAIGRARVSKDPPEHWEQ